MKAFYLLVAVMASTLGALAQGQLGIKAGGSINTVRYRDADPNNASIGYYAGAYTLIRLTQSDLFLRPEIQYSLKGYRSPLTGANGQVTCRLNYITLPILLMAPVGDKIQTMAGFEFGYLMKAVEKYHNTKNDITSRFQHFDWGLNIGGAYLITPTLGVELHYNYGFRGLVKGITVDGNGNPTGTNRDGANRVVQIGLFYALSSPSSGAPGNPRF
ncbi:porin family protein [Paraflavitalea sp. CAU 1676]|uniref:porin family protein n=1 Tax=Paraflavitalea sp. CAU 1676 TaxID=3032598 RepID=UPI0023DAF978|nr:porin family protein [Paraflavitalea sp. CAU 1676]MDF2193288.1 porin family protein [Paraflavitalea sp. CAU 1676]